MSEDGSRPSDEFAKAAEGAGGGLVSEFINYVRHSKKWWLAPILVVLLLLALLGVAAATPAAPFIYALF